MKGLVKATAFALVSLVATGVLANNKVGVSATLADEAARFGMVSESEWMSEIYRFEAGFMYNTNKDRMIDASILYTNKGQLDPNLDVGFKAKAALVVVDAVNKDTYGIMLGVFGRYWLPTPVPSALVAEVIHSPQIITFGEGDSMTELHVRAQTQLLRNLNGFVGYRSFRITQNNIDYFVDDAAHLGVELTF